MGTTWRRALPVLKGACVALRELQLRDAAALLTHLSGPNVARYIVPPPSTLEDMRRFIRWARRVRREGRHVIFGVVPAGQSEPVGVMQVWKVENDFSVAECGFVLSEAYSGQGLFTESATLMFDFAFHTLGVHRLEARVAVGNEQGHAVLRKLGAIREARLRDSFKRGDAYEDHILWCLVANDWIGLASSDRQTH